MEQIKPDLKYVEEAVELIIDAYLEERKSVPFLPYDEHYREKLKQSIEKLFTNGSGILLVEDDVLLGFLVGYENKELFGKSDGIYCPIYGHSALSDNRINTYQKLYEIASEQWVENGRLSHAITVFTHDTDLVKTWYWLGFGLRCVDSLREVSTIESSSTEVRKAALRDIPMICELHRQHNLYYRNSPIFMPNPDEDPIEDLKSWLKKENRHLWIAYEKEKPVGYIRIQPRAESFVSEDKDVMNITGIFVERDHRCSGVATSLLDSVQNWFLENNYKLCGVDFESINYLGSNFWNRYFTPYMYSMTRRIDERI